MHSGQDLIRTDYLISFYEVFCTITSGMFYVQWYKKTQDLEVYSCESNRENSLLNMEKYLTILMMVQVDGVHRDCTRHIFCYSAFVFLLGQKIEYFLHESAEKKGSEN